MDKATVIKVAKLTRIKIPENKLEHYAQELTDIMKVIEELKTADVTGLDPLINVSESDSSHRKDEITDGNYPDKVLKNAPQQKFDYFVVPKVIE